MMACSGGSKQWAEAPSYVVPTAAVPTSVSGEVWSQVVLAATPQRKALSVAVSLRGPLTDEGVCGQVRYANGCFGYWYCTPIVAATRLRDATRDTVATASATASVEAKERSFFVREMLDGSDACSSQGLRLRLTIMEGKKVVIREE
jgi:hypothetical protein